MRRVIIDCDPGHDDAVALLMALASPGALEILGITTVAGNIDVAQGERNARAICAAAGRPDIAVRAGCARPMVNALRDASDFHGPTGMGGWMHGLPDGPAHPEHAVDFIIASLKAATAPITLICLAPLTNIALALIKEPAIAANVEEIIIAGGARRAGGNVTPCATFNMVCDPHAAHVVFDSGLKLTVIGLDATGQVIVGPAETARLKALGTRSAQFAYEILEYFNWRRIQVYGYGPDQTALMDPCIVAFVLEPSLFDGTLVNVAIEHRSELTMGMTVVDLLGVSQRPANAVWVDRVDAAGVLRLMERTLSIGR